MRAFQYRQEAYRLRSHPSDSHRQQSSDSMAGIYFSFVPFMALEVVAELSSRSIPGGLVFPLGFFLFWAFYFTYYRPDTLEAHLRSRSSWSIAGLPSILLGVVIWILKLTVVELGEFLLFKWWSTPSPQPIRSFRAQAHAYAHPPTPPPQVTPIQKNTTLLPEEVLRALSTLGLSETRDWNQIHQRYRELAKMYHPDLNPSITSAGHRFMVYDAAYKKLSTFKSCYFTQKAA